MKTCDGSAKEKLSLEGFDELSITIDKNESVVGHVIDPAAPRTPMQSSG